MYLKKLAIREVGPIQSLDLELPFSPEGSPLPVLLVGQNGSGKTNLLSIIADSLFEMASTHFTDVTASRSGLSRPYFRVLGGSATRVGAAGSATILEFSGLDESDELYAAKSEAFNIFELAEGNEALGQRLRQLGVGEGDSKKTTMTPACAEKIFSSGPYVYFPSSRSETPAWLNTASIEETPFQASSRFKGQLHKPIFVERGLSELQQWLLSLLVDIRADTQPLPGQSFQIALNTGHLAHRIFWDAMNGILRAIVSDASARFVWFGRRNSQKLGFERAGIGALPLSALSAGQSTLLNIFGTLVRYGDVEGVASPGDIAGICLIDEIDAHIHVDLQSSVLPNLIALFSKVQFILTCHSPLFVLGIEGRMSTAIIQMPQGTRIQAEQYSEFEAAMESLRNTKAFQASLLGTANTGNEKAVIFLEGETDPIYFRTAAEALGYGDVLQLADFEWIGAKDPKSQQGFHTGKDALNSSLNFLRANPAQVKRRIVFLYDNDAGKADWNEGKLSVRMVPTNPDNRKVAVGIENLLPESVITDEMFDVRDTLKPNGNSATTRNLNKSRLCNQVCVGAPDAENFSKFDSLFEMLRRTLALPD